MPLPAANPANALNVTPVVFATHRPADVETPTPPTPPAQLQRVENRYSASNPANAGGAKQG